MGLIKFRLLYDQSKLNRLNFARLMSSQECHQKMFKASEIKITKAEKLKEKPTNLDETMFGSIFTDHILTIKWNNKDGWGTPTIKPMTDLNLHPASCVLHYANEIFEGMKTYITPTGAINMFRPMLHMDRFANGAKHACLPAFDKDELLKCICKLVEIDQEWIPQNDNQSLYIRPALIGTEPSFGVKRPTKALLFCLLTPVGPYFSTGCFKPISLLADPKYVRASRGGFGAYKFGSNYGPTVYIYEKAKELNCNHALWLYGEEQLITEAGTMNIFIHWINEHGTEELLTMGLDEGIVLPGITRQSVIDINRLWGTLKVTERSLSIKDFCCAVREGRVFEMFGTGTASVIVPVNRIVYQNQDYCLPENGFKLAKCMSDALTDIQYGKVEHEWSYRIGQVTRC